MKGLLTSILTVLTFTGLQAQPLPTTPKLVVGLTIDQLRTDYLEAFSTCMATKASGGFGKKDAYSGMPNILSVAQTAHRPSQPFIQAPLLRSTESSVNAGWMCRSCAP